MDDLGDDSNKMKFDSSKRTKSDSIAEEFTHNFNSGIIKKSEYFDLFISYKRDNGGDHGQKLAIELHERLTADGYKVWLDNEEIGFSSNFEQRIEEAILHSKKVVCVLGPGWAESPNCRYEVQKAIGFEKRIIPIHYQEFRDLLKSKKDQGELTQHEWDRIDKPQEINFSTKSAGRKGYEDLKAVCDLHDDITAEHNKILCESYYWKKYNSPKSMLPFGTYLTKVKLLRSKCSGDDELPGFTSFQDEFIEVAEKFVSSEVSHQRQAYISYGKDEHDFASELNFELKLNGVLTWFDDIRDKEIGENSFVEPMINCENVIDVVSENTSSEDEVRMTYARSNNKRILQVTHSKEILDGQVLAGVKNIYLWNDQVRIDEIITIINGDALYNSAHSKLLQQAFDWEKSENSNSKLLPYKEAGSTKVWYQQAEKSGNEPQPNLSMINFAERSVAYADTLRKRRIGLLWTAILGAILIIGLGWSAWTLKETADSEQLKVAKAQEKVAKALAKVEYADNLVLAANNDVVAADNKVIVADNLVLAADNLVLAADNLVIAANYKVVAADKKVVAAIDKVIAADMKVIVADNLVLDANEKVLAAENELVKTQKKTNAAKLSLEAYELTVEGNYNAAKEKANLAVDLFEEIGDDYETDILYNTYYSILSKKLDVDSDDMEFVQQSTINANTIVLNHCNYAVDSDFKWGIVKQIEKDTNLVYSMVISDNGKVGSLGLKSGKIILFDNSNFETIDTVSVGTYRVTSMGFNNKSTQLVASTIDDKFTIISLSPDGKRDLTKQLIRRKSFGRIEQIEYEDNNTIMAVGGKFDDDGVMKKFYQKYPATVKKLKEIIGEND